MFKTSEFYFHCRLRDTRTRRMRNRKILVTIMADNEATVNYSATKGILAPTVKAGYSWPVASEEDF